MQNFIKTIINGVQNWTKKEIKQINNRISGSQADWNQNDENADSYIKNRPFYKGYKVLFDGSFVAAKDPELGWETVGYTDAIVRFEFGEKYIVDFDGVEYITTAEDYDAEGVLVIDNDGNIQISDIFGKGLIILNAPAGAHTLKIRKPNYFKIDEKYLPDNLATTDDVQDAIDVANGKMDASNPVGTGSFSMNRLSGTTIGNYSVAMGKATTASGDYSHAEGYGTTASGAYSHAEGYDTTASSLHSHAEGCRTEASNSCSHAEGHETIAYGPYSHAEGNRTTASGYYSHAEGCRTEAQTQAQHVQGEYNILDTGAMQERGKYAHIVGNGTYTKRSNAHTLDWSGVGWFQGGLQVGGNAQDDGAKNVLLEGDAIPVPSTAEVSQILTVKSIDASGKPTEWECVDAPESGADVDLTGYATEEYVDSAIANKIEVPVAAQIGQTIVVKSVDETGKPIEWEAVDPWVIASSTEGSTKKFKVTIDDDGTLNVAEVVE